MQPRNHSSSLPPPITLVRQQREQLVPYEELAAASAEKLAAEKEEAMDEAYTQVGTNVTRGVRPVSVLGSRSSAAEAVTGASVSLAGPFHWPPPARGPRPTAPRARPVATIHARPHT